MTQDFFAEMAVFDSKEDPDSFSGSKDAKKGVSITDAIRFRVRLSFMELSVKEVNSIVKAYVKSHKSVKGLSSWKFPHLKLSDVKVEEYLIQQNRKNICIETRYLNTTEMLIDRLYYGINVFGASTQDLIDKVETNLLLKDLKSLNCFSTLECEEGHESTNVGVVTRTMCNKITTLKKLIDQLITQKSSGPTACRFDSSTMVDIGVTCKPTLKDTGCQVMTTMYKDEWVDNTIEEYESFIKVLRSYQIENCRDIGELNIIVGNERRKNALLKRENELLSSALKGKCEVIDELKRQVLAKEVFCNQRIVEMEQKCMSNVDCLKESNSQKQEKIDSLEEELRKVMQKIEDMQYFPDLNGPVTVIKEQSSVSETIQKQCAVNEERIKALQNMNAKYQNVIAKLNNSTAMAE